MGDGVLLVDGNGEYLTKDGSGVIHGDNGRLLPEARDLLSYLPMCPECCQPIVDKDGVPLSENDVKGLRRRLVCLNIGEDDRLCGAQLWGAINGGRTKPPRWIGGVYFQEDAPVF